MRRSVIAATALLASVSLVGAQGFDSYDYTSSSSSTTSYSEPEMKFAIFMTGGAGFSLGGEYVGSSIKMVDRTAGTETLETDDEYMNFGRGLKIDLGASYRFMKHVDVMGGINLSIGTPQTEVEREFTDETASPVDVWKDVTTYQHTQFGFKVLLAPRFIAFDLIDMYIGAGLGLYWNSLSHEREVTNNTTAVRYTEEVEYDTKPTIPFIATVGTEYPVLDRLIIYLDATFEAMNVTVQEQKVSKTNFPQNPVFTSPGFGSIQGSETQKYEEDATDRAAPPKIPASNFAIRLGVRVPLF